MVILAIVSLANFLVSELYFLLCEYNKLELVFVLIVRFSLELALSFMVNHFSFDMYGCNTF